MRREGLTQEVTGCRRDVTAASRFSCDPRVRANEVAVSS